MDEPVFLSSFCYINDYYYVNDNAFAMIINWYCNELNEARKILDL